MKKIINIQNIEYNNNFILYKKLLNISIFTQKKITKQLGFNFLIKKNNFLFETKKIKITYLKITNLLSYLLINKKFYKLMHNHYNMLLKKKKNIYKIYRLTKGLPVNGQRTKTNAKNCRKQFYLKYQYNFTD